MNVLRMVNGIQSTPKPYVKELSKQKEKVKLERIETGDNTNSAMGVDSAVYPNISKCSLSVLWV